MDHARRSRWHRRPALAIIAVALAVVGCPPKPPVWDVCTCDEEKTVTIDTSPCGGTVILKPQQASYPKGSLVKATFIPAWGTFFDEWETIPASIACGDYNLTTYFYVTDDMVVRATCKGWMTLSISWDPDEGNVDVTCPGGTITSWFRPGKEGRSVEALDGMNIYLSGIAKDPSHEVLWNATDGMALQYGGSVTMRTAAIMVECEFPHVSPSVQWHNVTTSIEGGGKGEIFISGDSTTWMHPGCFLQDSARVRHGASAHLVARPLAGYAIEKWSWEEGGELQTTCFEVGGRTVCMPFFRAHITEDRHFTAHFVPKVKLTLQTEGEGVIKSDDLAYDYDPGEEIALYAEPCIGWVFDHWELEIVGDGAAAKKGELKTTNPCIFTIDSDMVVTAIFQHCWSGCPECTGAESNSFEAVPMLFVPGICLAGPYSGACGFTYPAPKPVDIAVLLPCYDECWGRFTVEASQEIEVTVCNWMNEIDPCDLSNIPEEIYCLIVEHLVTEGCLYCELSCDPPSVWGSSECVLQHEMKHFSMFLEELGGVLPVLQAHPLMEIAVDCDDPYAASCQAALEDRRAAITDLVKGLYAQAWQAQVARGETDPTQAAQLCNEDTAWAICQYAEANGWSPCEYCELLKER